MGMVLQIADLLCLSWFAFWAGEAPAEPRSWTEKIGNVSSGAYWGFVCWQLCRDNVGLIFGRPVVAVVNIFQGYQ